MSLKLEGRFLQSPGLAEPVNLRSRKFLFFQRSIRSWARAERMGASLGEVMGAGAARAVAAKRVVRMLVKCILVVGLGGLFVWLFGLFGLFESMWK